MYRWSPSIDISTLRDVLSDISYGYSFVTDPANGLTDAYLELSRRACLSDAEGLLTDDDWDTRPVCQYLDLQREFQDSIMLLISLFGGQMPCGTDLLAVAHCNSAANRRGILVYEGKFAIVAQVNKARRATNKEFFEARYLPDELAPLLYQYLVYVRRFCDMLHRTCLGLDVDRSLLFPSTANPHEPRKTEELTKLLKSCTESATGAALGVRVYRQLTIAITEKHIKQMSQLFNLYDDTTSKADSGVAFAWRSGHRPIQRGISYGLDGAFPDSLQPALLRVYKWVSEEWHRFLNLEPILSASASSDAIPGVHARQALVMAETAGAAIQRGHGCLQYELDRSIFRTSKKMLEQCSEASRLVMITYKGDEYCRPSALLPVAGVSARKISIAWYTTEYKPFVA
jgi:hypothetical protein